MPELDLAPPPDGLDAYMWRRLGHHLIEAGRAPDLRRLLLDPAWLQRKLDATDVGALLADFDLLPGDEALTPVAAAIRLSAHVVGRDPSQLPSQLTGRLATIDVPEVQELLARTQQLQSRPWLRPLRGGLTPPGAGQLATLEGHTGRAVAVAVSADGTRAVSGGDDGMVRVWDVASGSVTATLERHFGGVWAVAVSADGTRAVSGGDDGMVRAWDVASETLTATFTADAPPQFVVLDPKGATIFAADPFSHVLRLKLEPQRR